MYSTLIDSKTLHDHVENPNWIVVDCRFSLADTDWGRSEYRAAHIPGAAYAHLDDDLSGPPVTDAGRHPLPTPEALTAVFSRPRHRFRQTSGCLRSWEWHVSIAVVVDAAIYGTYGRFCTGWRVAIVAGSWISQCVAGAETKPIRLPALWAKPQKERLVLD